MAFADRMINKVDRVINSRAGGRGVNGGRDAMKASVGGYARATDLRHALDLLAASDGTGRVLAGGQSAGPEQIDRLIASAVMASERFYPAFQLVGWGDKSPEAAVKVAIA